MPRETARCLPEAVPMKDVFVGFVCLGRCGVSCCACFASVCAVLCLADVCAWACSEGCAAHPVQAHDINTEYSATNTVVCMCIAPMDLAAWHLQKLCKTVLKGTGAKVWPVQLDRALIVLVDCGSYQRVLVNFYCACAVLGPV